MSLHVLLCYILSLHVTVLQKKPSDDNVEKKDWGRRKLKKDVSFLALAVLAIFAIISRLNGLCNDDFVVLGQRFAKIFTYAQNFLINCEVSI